MAGKKKNHGGKNNPRIHRPQNIPKPKRKHEGPTRMRRRRRPSRKPPEGTVDDLFTAFFYDDPDAIALFKASGTKEVQAILANEGAMNSLMEPYLNFLSHGPDAPFGSVVLEERTRIQNCNRLHLFASIKEAFEACSFGMYDVGVIYKLCDSESGKLERLILLELNLVRKMLGRADYVLPEERNIDALFVGRLARRSDKLTFNLEQELRKSLKMNDPVALYELDQAERVDSSISSIFGFTDCEVDNNLEIKTPPKDLQTKEDLPGSDSPQDRQSKDSPEDNYQEIGLQTEERQELKVEEVAQEQVAQDQLVQDSASQEAVSEELVSKETISEESVSKEVASKETVSEKPVAQKTKPQVVAHSEPKEDLPEVVAVAREWLNTLFEKMRITGIGFKIDYNEATNELKIDTKPESPEAQERFKQILRKGNSISRNIEAYQTLLTEVLIRRTSQRVDVSFDVDDYVKNRIARFEGVADDLAELAIEQGKTITIAGLTSFDRRVVHNRLASKRELETESVGQGAFRKLVICVK